MSLVTRDATSTWTEQELLRSSERISRAKVEEMLLSQSDSVL